MHRVSAAGVAALSVSAGGACRRSPATAAKPASMNEDWVSVPEHPCGDALIAAVEDNFERVRLALALAADAYTAPARPRTAFGRFAARYDDQIAAGAARGLKPLTASFGPAQVDRAVLDAVCRSAGRSFYEATRTSLPGIVPALLPAQAGDLAGFDLRRFLAQLTPAQSITARHTVGLLDPIADHPPSSATACRSGSRT